VSAPADNDACPQLREGDGATVSADTIAAVQHLFAAHEVAIAVSMLADRCGTNLPFMEKASPVALERERFAALRLSGGSLDRLRRAVELATTDSRDLLMAADFGQSLTAHREWWDALVGQ
jgi:hypothetical protein